jgi:hypothetical protein
VREFVVPACARFSVLTTYAEGELPGDVALPLGPLPDEEFLRLRQGYLQDHASIPRTTTPRRQRIEVSAGVTLEVQFC